MNYHDGSAIHPIDKRRYFLNGWRIPGYFDTKFATIVHIEPILQKCGTVPYHCHIYRVNMDHFYFRAIPFDILRGEQREKFCQPHPTYFCHEPLPTDFLYLVSHPPRLRISNGIALTFWWIQKSLCLSLILCILWKIGLCSICGFCVISDFCIICGILQVFIPSGYSIWDPEGGCGMEKKCEGGSAKFSIPPLPSGSQME